MRSKPDMTFDEWRQAQSAELAKAPTRGGAVSPISPYQATAPVGPPGTPYGQRLLDVNSKYSSDPRIQPNPWIDDVDVATDFYSPMQPLWPMGPPNVNVPREWDYPIGYNLNYVPQRIELMAMLRGMRASWGVLATIVSTRQDQLLRIPWTIQRKDNPRRPSVAVDEMKKFFKQPDGKNRYSQWANKLLDDLLVIDAPCIFLPKDRAGRPLAAEILDGATIFPLIDDTGRRPDSIVEWTDEGLRYLRRQPAFQQIIKGLPLVNLDESEIMYTPMRPRPNLPMFGYPATEQILVEASEAIRKTFYQLNFWQEGTIPDLVVTVPDTWTPRQIAMFQAHFDAMLSGNLRLKSKVRFLPGGMKPFDIKNSSGDSLWSQRDETLIRLAAYAYSVSPTPFVKQVNRSVAQNAQESAEQEGLYPLMAFWKDNIMDVIVQEKFFYEDVEFIFLPRPERDAEKQATVHQIRLKQGMINRNEARADLGYEPIDGGDAYMIELGNAVIPVVDAAAGGALPMSGGANNGSDGSTSRPSGEAPAGNSPQRGAPTPDHAAPSVSKLLSSTDVDDAAAFADGGLHHSHRRLTAGNYRKGHLRLAGLDISVENSAGSIRGKKNSDGSVRWANHQPAHYGYIRGTLGADGDCIDCFIGRRPDLVERAWVIDQMKVSKKGRLRFDEHKVMLGYKSLKRVLKDYKKAYDGKQLFGNVTELSLDELKSWLKGGSTQSPIADTVGKVVYRTSADFSKLGDTVSASTGLIGRSHIRRKKMKRPRLQLN